MKRFLLFVVFALAVASTASAGDLTTVTSVEARYFVNLGKVWGDTVSAGEPTGLYELATGRGNGSPWWRINDGVLTEYAANTFGASGSDFVGYFFKFPANIDSIVFTDYVYGDGGTFLSTPTLMVLNRGLWNTVAASCSPAYDASFNIGVHQYTFTPSTTLNNVDGVRLMGPAAGTEDGDGFIGVIELQLFGEMILPRLVDLTKDLTGGPGTTAFSNHSQYDLANLIDDDLATYDTTVWSGKDSVDHGRYDHMGVMFAQPQRYVTAFGIILKFFSDGGWYEEAAEPFTIEYTEDNGSTWIPVTGLVKGIYPGDYPLLDALGYPVETGFLFIFDPISVPIDGLRIWGDGAGTADPYPFTDTEGFLGASEIEVFGNGTVFVEGFESGDLSAWSMSVP